VEAISAGAPVPLVHHLTSTDAVVRELSCRSLCALAMLVEGRAAVVAAAGVPAVTNLLADQLPSARTAAAETLAALSAGPEGHVAVLASTSGALQRVVRACNDDRSGKDPSQAERVVVFQGSHKRHALQGSPAESQ
jgi:hypothetical protein